jgi:hypothetical protein
MSNTIIQIKHSTESGNVPSSLANGEIALNSYDGKLFYIDPDGIVQFIQKFTGPAGLNGEIQFNDSGDLGSSSNLTFNKTTGNLSSQSIHTRTYIEFGDGTRQYTANAGEGGGGTTDSVARELAQSSYDHANASFDKANSANVLAQASFDQANTDVTSVSVTPGVYGNSTIVPVITVASNGRITSVTNTTITVSGGGGGASITWIKKTENYTAVNGDRIIADTSDGSFVITLPSSPSLGDVIVIADGDDWSANTLNVSPNGSTIEGFSDELELDVPGIRVDFVYSGSTWEVYTFAPPQISIIDDTTTDESQYLTMARQTTGPWLNSYVSSEKLYYNPLTGSLNAINFNSLSDATLKQNINTIDNALDLIEKINPVKFKWKNNKKNSYGVIAQEIENILPDLVETNKQNNLKSVSYTQLIPILVESIKELKKEIDFLKNEK